MTASARAIQKLYATPISLPAAALAPDVERWNGRLADATIPNIDQGARRRGRSRIDAKGRASCQED